MAKQNVNQITAAGSGGLIVTTDTQLQGLAPMTMMEPSRRFLSGVTFTSQASGGATGNTASGSGDIADFLSLPVGGKVIYTAGGKIDPATQATSFTNTATATVPAGVTDTNAIGSTALDTDTLSRRPICKSSARSRILHSLSRPVILLPNGHHQKQRPERFAESDL